MRKESSYHRVPFSSNNYQSQYPKTKAKTQLMKGSKKWNENSYVYDNQKQGVSSQLSYYQLAKNYEYGVEAKDLDKALEYYYKALYNNQRKDSTIKDLAGVLHQKGRTQQAVDFLVKYRKQYRGDILKYDNLIENLSRQIQLPSGKNLNKFILILNMQRESTLQDVKKLFSNTSRILDIKFYKDLSFSLMSSIQDIPCAIIQFPTYSAAKKTADTFDFSNCSELQLYWISKGRQDPLKLNCFYFGDDKLFDNMLEVMSFIPCQIPSQFKRLKIEEIWSNEKSLSEAYEDTQEHLVSRRHLQNNVKLNEIRSRKKNIQK